MKRGIPQTALVSAVNDEEVLASNLLRSPDIRKGWCEVLTERGHHCAGSAYNAALERTTAEVVVFVHQDVYLPAGWFERLDQAIAVLEERQEPWGILGVWGVRRDGRMVGRVWSSGGNRQYIGLTGELHTVASVDEIVIVLNNRHGLKFDSVLPGFHLYATDLIMQARQRGLTAHAIDAPVVHNSRLGAQPLDRWYRAAYYYMQKKWARDLPLRTCVIDVTASGLPLWRRWMRYEIRRLRGGAVSRPRHSDPEGLALTLGYVWPRNRVVPPAAI